MISLYFERGPFSPQIQTPVVSGFVLRSPGAVRASRLCRSRTPGMAGTCVPSPRQAAAPDALGKEGSCSQEGALPCPTLA